jgi:hypothetical protein
MRRRLLPSPLRCSHQPLCLHRILRNDKVFRTCNCRSVDDIVLVLTIINMVMSLLLFADLMKLAIEILHEAYELYSI